MASTRIRFTLNPQDIRDAVGELERFKEGYREKIERTLKLVAETSAEYLRQSYLSATDYEGSIDVSVYVETIGASRFGPTYRVIATGETLFFLEYGTGIYAQADPYGMSAVDAYPGSWSETHDQQFSTKGYWMYNGRIQFGSQPVHAFYYLSESMAEIVQEAVAEVFG